MVEENEQLLIESTEYLKSGIHIGTKFKTKYMAEFIYKTRPDGLSVMNLKRIDERIQLAVNMLSKYEPQDILFVGRRENTWKPLRLVQQITGIRVVAGRYPPGILTNSNLETFIEPKIILVADPWPDKNAVLDAKRMGLPIIALCDTNNQSNEIDLVVPCNNKGKKSVGMFFYLFTREYLLKKGKISKPEEFPHKPEDFMDE